MGIPKEIRNFRIRIFVLIGAIFALLALALYFSYSPTSEFYGQVFTHAVTSQKVVALTFDDGPNGATTQQVLAILKKENIKATFFLIGENVQTYPDLAKQEAEQGNELGNHTMYHQRELPFDRKKEIVADLLQTDATILTATGQSPKFFRPPYGFRTPWVLTSAHIAGLIPVTWNDLTHDYADKSADQIAKPILASVKPGSIIVLHDGSATRHGVMFPAMIQALPKIIDSLKAQGYTFATVSELYAINHAK